MSAAERSSWITEQARAIGFDLCGITAISREDDSWPELARNAEWLARGHAGEMRWLSDPRRESPQQVMQGARSVIVCAVNYNSAHPYSTQFSAAESSDDSPHGWISRYAWGTDYHQTIGAKLESLVNAMRAQFTAVPFDAKWYVDTGPIHERIAAQRAGLGTVGKHTLLIHPELGSWIFLCVIVTTLDLAASSDIASAQFPPTDVCGQCTLCIDACPTSAIVEPYVLDARLCISYLTIELRGAIPESLRAQMGRQVFGCDICQDVCPWNREAPTTKEEVFAPRENLLAPELEWIASMTEEEFRETFRASPIKRAKYRGIIRNACVAIGNSNVKRDSETHLRVMKLLGRLAESSDEIISEHARWAAGKMKSKTWAT
ncbi:MAG TPA: tRNA epoxyqueuosine(34) reductase QueG [Candidatus Acidoferrales bacterium]